MGRSAERVGPRSPGAGQGVNVLELHGGGGRITVRMFIVNG